MVFLLNIYINSYEQERKSKKEVKIEFPILWRCTMCTTSYTIQYIDYFKSM